MHITNSIFLKIYFAFNCVPICGCMHMSEIVCPHRLEAWGHLELDSDCESLPTVWVLEVDIGSPQ